jgi:hypothetical protein
MPIDSVPAHELVTFDTVRQFALELPEVVESTSYGTPAFKVRKKLLARLKEDGETLAIMIEFGDREFRLGSQPDVFYITPHYDGYPMILVRLAKVHPNDLRDLVHGAWRMVAPKSLLAQLPQ